jgi:predicted DNA-binding transcriptional regulator YafY
MNRIDRLFAIATFLASRRVTRAAEIADEFGISVRTVYRDIVALSEAGIPISGEAGTGYAMLHDYFLPPVDLGADERNALALAAEFFRAASPPEFVSGALRSAVRKVSVSSPSHRSRGFRDISGSIHIKTPPSHANATLGHLVRATLEWQLLDIVYEAGRDAVTRRKIEPYGLHWGGSAWFLVAYCRLRVAFRMFRVDRIKSLTMTGVRFDRDPGFDLQRYLKEHISNESPERVLVHFNADVKNYARADFEYAIVAEKELESGIELTLTTWSRHWLVTKLLVYGDTVEIMGPPEARADLIEEVRKILARYDSRPPDPIRVPVRRTPDRQLSEIEIS